MNNEKIIGMTTLQSVSWLEKQQGLKFSVYYSCVEIRYKNKISNGNNMHEAVQNYLKGVFVQKP